MELPPASARARAIRAPAKAPDRIRLVLPSWRARPAGTVRARSRTRGRRPGQGRRPRIKPTERALRPSTNLQAFVVATLSEAIPRRVDAAVQPGGRQGRAA